MENRMCVKRVFRVLLVGLFAWLLLPMGGCAPEEWHDDSASVRLTFSADTLSFDTVFAAMGTATRRLTVYNTTSDDLRLSSVTLGRGAESRFRLNVDGDTALVARDVEIASGDSIFIFVQARINPTSALEPFIVTDSILFSNGQTLPLTAWGRNAYYHRRADTSAGVLYDIDVAAWNAGQHDRPHVILGYGVVREGQTLRLVAGEEVYFGPDAMLIVDSAARLEVDGSAERPVVFGSVRRDGWYSFLPGQWQMVWFYTASSGAISHARFENGTGGLRCYPEVDLALNDVTVCQMSDAAVVGQNARIVADDLLVYGCKSAVVLIGGGDYTFRHATLADYWRYGGRDTAAVVVSNYYPLENGVYAADMVRAEFADCIIYGNYSRGEAAVTAMEGYLMNSSFEGSLVRGGAWDEDPMFEDPSEDDYHLREGSPAEGKGYRFPE